MEPFQTQINEAEERALHPPQERAQPRPGASRAAAAPPSPSPGLGSAPKDANPGGKRRKRGWSGRRSRGNRRGAQAAPRRTCAASIPERREGFSSKKEQKQRGERFLAAVRERERARGSLPSAERKGEMKIPEVGKSEPEHGRCLEKHSPLQCQTSSQTP